MPPNDAPLWSEETECDDCLLRQQERHSMYLRIRHVDRGVLLPTGRKLDERCEACGGTGRIPYARVW